MITRISGTLLEKNPPTIVVDVQGIGYELLTPMTTFDNLAAVGSDVQLYTHFLVREDAQILYAFADTLTREVFRLLIRVNGLGPKLALAVLSSLSIDELNTYIINDEVKKLISIPGIGKKTAERLIVETKDKFIKMFKSIKLPSSDSKLIDDAISALVVLGYKAIDAEKTVSKININTNTTSESIIKQALRQMVR